MSPSQPLLTCEWKVITVEMEGDSVATTLVGDRLADPSGEQTATNLVRGLLAGPGSIALDNVRISKGGESIK